MRYSMKQILESYTPEKRKESSIWARLVSRPLSFPLTYLFMNTGLSANTVSVISMIDVALACIFITIGGQLLWLGIALYVLWHVLDCCDGNIARVKRSFSLTGEFFDAVSGYIAPSFIFLSVGVAAFRTSPLPESIRYILIVLGGMASISDILGRLVYQKYVVTEYRFGNVGKEGNIDRARTKGKMRVIDKIMRAMTYSCAFMPLLVISSIFNYFDAVIMLFFLYNLAFMLASTVFFLLKATKLTNEEKSTSTDSKTKEDK